MINESSVGVCFLCAPLRISQRFNLTSSTAIFLSVLLLAMLAHPAPAHGADILELFADDFNDLMPGSLPAGWQTRSPYREASEVFALRKRDGDDCALEFKGMYYNYLDFPFGRRLEHGRLSVSLDLQVVRVDESIRAVISVDHEEPAIDVGWPPAREYAAFLVVRGKLPGIYSVSWDRKDSLLAELKPGVWIHVDMVLDLIARKYTV